ncbi:hypothetical protein I7I50_00343 [Histoplasma capsulatum G186AR]|uniref:Uncharacterized protein n=1 Tax=Ajellomyces capsulatus TaxID=5037 RepID=A0A8H8CUP8_AJECA|nr:hypothetical protein I7I52_07611 [Histoplasma capsulatum]QSS72483.1 hypothetical protein I7I50_00343 [Histoplasma capsulatum G186AR]
MSRIKRIVRVRVRVRARIDERKKQRRNSDSETRREQGKKVNTFSPSDVFVLDSFPSLFFIIVIGSVRFRTY